MGQSAKRKRQRAAGPAQSQHDLDAQREAERGRRGHRLRLILLAAIPVVAIGGAVAVAQLLDSRPGAGMLLLVGCALWITVLASDIGRDIPPRDRTRASGLGFGRNA